MTAHGCTDATAIVGLHSPVVLLDVGAQTVTSPLDPTNPGVALTQTSPVVRLAYAGPGLGAQRLHRQFQVRARTAPPRPSRSAPTTTATTRRPIYTPDKRGADWANLVIDMVRRADRASRSSAPTTSRPGSRARRPRRRPGRSNYLQNASRSHTLIFNGSADGCPDGFGGTHRRARATTPSRASTTSRTPCRRRPAARSWRCRRSTGRATQPSGRTSTRRGAAARVRRAR